MSRPRRGDSVPGAAFERLARFSIRFRWAIVVVWIAAVVVATAALPSLSSVAKSNNTQFLSSSAPSVQAGRLAAPFQGKSGSSSAIIIASRATSSLTAADLAAIGRVEQAARAVAGVTLVRDEGTSADGQASEALVTVSSAVANSSASKRVVEQIRASFTRVSPPRGLSFHLAGPLAVSVDSSNTHSGAIATFTLLFVVVLLFVVYRAALAPLITLIPAALSFLLAGRLVGEAAHAGLSMPSVAQQLLIVLLLGAGSDYGLFLSFRTREELTRGLAPRAALIAAIRPVGEAITYSGLTVAAALLTLLLASFSIYRGLGPALAIGIAVLLAATLTLTTALLAIFGRAAFWPCHPKPGTQTPRLWGRVAERVVKRPRATLAAGVAVFAALTAGLVGYQTAGLTSNTAPSGSDSAAGAKVLAAHFPKATVGSDQLLLHYRTTIWNHPATLARAQRQLATAPVFRSLTGPLGPGTGTTSPNTLLLSTARSGRPTSSHTPHRRQAGCLPASIAPTAKPASSSAPTAARSSTTPCCAPARSAGHPPPPRSPARATLTVVAHGTGATANGIAGQDASANDINQASTSSLQIVVPVVLALILMLLALLLRSLVAPWYLALTVGLSYLASLGFAMIAFVHLGGQGGLIFVLPLLMFVFSMALGEDYNILVMSRIREETQRHESFRAALTHAIGITGGTITSAGIILAGTFAVLGIAGGSSEAQQLGYSIAFGVLLDTFFVRSLLIPSIAMLLGPLNWWPMPAAAAPPALATSKQPALR